MLTDIKQNMSGRRQTGIVAASGSPIVRLESLESPFRKLDPSE
jgi:hypothetical protein